MSLKEFFSAYMQYTNNNDIAATVACFADTFLVAGPNGAQAVRSADFALALPKRKQLFESLGSRGATLATLDETPLDTRYTLTRTRWRMDFPAQSFEVGALHLIDIAGDSPKIVAYLTPEDIFTVLRSRGLMPATS
ncbi:MAG TPA: hypothetical protein VG893_10065 [Terracidiphilus sp.]|nr:hypothetical protein [Terracidiphilus sp.]